MNLAVLRSSTAKLLERISLEPKSWPEGHNGAGRYTDRFVLRKLGPLDLRAGDLVLVTAYEQLDNENYEAKGPWKVPTPQGWQTSEHWSLWVGHEFDIRRGPGPIHKNTDPRVGAAAGRNWDGYVHHEPVELARWDFVKGDFPGTFYYTTVWFTTSADQRNEGAEVIVRDRGQLTVAIFR